MWNTAQVRVSTLLGRFESGGLSAAPALTALLDELQALICSCVMLASKDGASLVGWAGLPHCATDGSHVPSVDSPSPSGVCAPSLLNRVAYIARLPAGTTRALARRHHACLGASGNDRG